MSANVSMDCPGSEPISQLEKNLKMSGGASAQVLFVLSLAQLISPLDIQGLSRLGPTLHVLAFQNVLCVRGDS